LLADDSNDANCGTAKAVLFQNKNYATSFRSQQLEAQSMKPWLRLKHQIAGGAR
jgi:hypothetical protein